MLMEYIQGLVDKNPEKRFLLSGSSNFEPGCSYSSGLLSLTKVAIAIEVKSG